MKFEKLALDCEKLSERDSRNEKIKIISNLLKDLDHGDIRRACRMIIGRPFPKSSQRTTNLSKKTLLNALEGSIETEKYGEYYDKYGDAGEVIRRLMGESRTKQSTLTAESTDLKSIQGFLDGLSKIRGKGSRKGREKLIDAKFSQITPLEGKYLTKLLLGSSRHGVSDGMVVHGIARAWGEPLEEVRRAYMLTGDLGEAAVLSKSGELKRVEIQYQRPFLPMLAEMADVAAEIVERMGRCLCEEKLDGIRIQVHKADETGLYTRNLNKVTENFPEVIRGLEEVDGKFIAEGELVAEKEGHILPFQKLMRRFRESVDEQLIEEIPAKVYFFDLLRLGRASLVDAKLMERIDKLRSKLASLPLTRRIITENVREIEKFYQNSVERGNEGIITKDPESKYHPGERGKDWLKLKRAGETLDLVITRADYGHGKRHRWLSDYYLAAYDEKEGEFREIGKTYKGLTDEEIKVMTERLKDIVISREGRTVEVEPKIVVEVEYSNIFTGGSSSYDAGFTLRFARIKEIRDDLPPEDADTLSKVSELANREP